MEVKTEKKKMLLFNKFTTKKREAHDDSKAAKI